MDTEIEEVKQEIRKVQDQIDRVEGQLTQAPSPGDDVAYFRKKKEEQLRKILELWLKNLEQLREEKLVLLKAGTSERHFHGAKRSCDRDMLIARYKRHAPSPMDQHTVKHVQCPSNGDDIVSNPPGASSYSWMQHV